MNLFFKCLLAFLIFTNVAHAINLKAIYTAACQRELGVIIDVDDSRVRLLKIDGNLVDIRRYEIIFLADYPIDQFPHRGRLGSIDVPTIRVSTRQDNAIVGLIRGWPIGFTPDKVAFLSNKGREGIIDRESIWHIESKKESERLVFKNGYSSKELAFVHPYSFRDCKLNRGRKVYPQQILSDPVVIKRELDKLQSGYQRLARYIDEQKFYPVPQIYKNKTSLGIWHNVGSRHGVTEKRTNNFLPVLIDEYSSDVFDYQHIFITGSTPSPYHVHDEAQTQAYYGFKASYFHFAAMADPNLILVGQNYEWQPSDLQDRGEHINNTIFFDLGFDFGNWTIGTFTSGTSYGLSTDNGLVSGNMAFSGFIGSYRNHLFKVEFLSGSAEEEKDFVVGEGSKMFSINFQRLNFYTYFLGDFDLYYSFISRSIDNEEDFNFQSDSTSHSVVGKYSLTRRIDVSGYLSVESSTWSDDVSEDSGTFPKAGAAVFLSF